VVQAAALPYRWNEGQLEIALVTRRQGDRWTLPKGHVESGETPRQSARREASEEAGLQGRIAWHPLGSYVYRKGDERRLVWVFLMRVTRQLSSWSEDDFREREWLRPERAIERVGERGLRILLRGLPKRVGP
jgi:8-oxo-dGTP pyrophosphatase MutT (NUDIX family)